MEIVILIIELAVTIFYLYALIKLFEKAGKRGVFAIIPYVNVYHLYSIAKMKIGWFIAYLVSSTMIVYSNYIFKNTVDFNIWLLVALIIGGIVLLVANIKQASGLAKAFKKDKGFALGLFFLPIIFIAILAFGDAEYTK